MSTLDTIDAFRAAMHEAGASSPDVIEADGLLHRFHIEGDKRGTLNGWYCLHLDGRAAGMQTFLRPGFTPPIVKAESNVYLFEGVVTAEARGGGIGTALLQESMAWAARAGFETCTLHYASANPLGAPFWLRNGFVPVEHTMANVIDERIAWARPRP